MFNKNINIIMLAISTLFVIFILYISYTPKPDLIEEPTYDDSNEQVKIINEAIVNDQHVIVIDNPTRYNYKAKIISTTGDIKVKNDVTLAAGQTTILFHKIDSPYYIKWKNKIKLNKIVLKSNLNDLIANAIIGSNVKISITNIGRDIRAPLRGTILYYDENFNILDYNGFDIGSYDYIISSKETLSYILNPPECEYSAFGVYINYK